MSDPTTGAVPEGATPEAPAPQETPEVPAGDGGGGGLDFIPEEFREASWAQKYSSADEFFKGVDNMNKLVGQRPEGLVPPGEDATDEERAAFHSKLREMQGVPGEFEEYSAGLTLPEVGEDATLPELVQLAHAEGVPPAAMQKMVDHLYEGHTAARKAEEEQYENALSEATETLKGEWGDEFDHKVLMAERMLSEFPDDAVELIVSSGAGNNPAIVRALHGLAEKYLSEDDLKDLGNGSDGGELTEAKLAKMMQDPRYADPDQRDPAYVREIEEGFRRLYPE
ncbi:hypothetical protein [Salidesulfovibrio brasiliensis]|uniref:hypothetical protein n=1 Tax=Salidesulfovibrio brasiliensis TaxID=221711 RepID=UPI0006D02B56|nr:hypothetical protein [Salidesulfovibrio brasiliensis]